MSYCRFKEQDREEYDLLGPPHPGEILREDVCPRLKMSRKALATQLGISSATVARLLKERSRINAKVAMELARISGTNALYWLLLQAHHDAWHAERSRDQKLPGRMRSEDFGEQPIQRRGTLSAIALID